MSYDDTARALDALTDHVGFERLVTQLLARAGRDVRPIGGSGDKGRDAVSGLYRAKAGEELAVTISLKESWNSKIASDVSKLVKAGFKPTDVISVTNRTTSETKRSALQNKVAKDHKINLTIYDVRWLIVQLHLRDNLDLRSEYLHLPPLRPAFFMDVGEYAQLLDRRGLLISHFAGREEELNELKRLLDQDTPVILEAAGGLGKTRLAFELARSGMSDERWFFVDADRPFSIDYIAEIETGYEALVLIDDAHRRSDLAQLVAGLETRTPVPKLVFTVRPGHAQSVSTQLTRFAFPPPQTLALQPIGRSALAKVLTEAPYLINEGLVSHLLSISEGSISIALIGAELARAGVEPSDLAQSDLFAEHATWRLAGAGLDDRPSRDALALVAALGSLDMTNQAEARVARELLEDQTLTRRLEELADAGLVIEDEPGRFTIKPDILREHLFRSSFFPDRGRPLLRYETVYGALAPTRLRSLVASLGDSRADLASGSNTALTRVRNDLMHLVDTATTPDDLVAAADLVRALGPSAGGIDVAERILKRIEADEGQHVDRVGSRLVAALSTAKFGRDQLGHAWDLLLRLARLAFALDLTETRQAALTEIRGIYSAAPLNYSSKDPFVLAYVQHSVREATETWWTSERDRDGAGEVAAAVVEPAFHLQLEQHRTSAANAMAITMIAAYLPASSETEAMLTLGAQLLQEALPRLGAREQLQLVERISALGHVAGGHSGLFGLVPDTSLQTLAATVLADVEAWLVAQLDTLPLPVGAEVVFHFAMRGRWPKGTPRVRAPRAKGELRAYLDLIDGRSRALNRLDWETELAKRRTRARRYGTDLGKSKDWQETLQRLSRWIDEYEALTGNTADNVALEAMLDAAGERSAERAFEVASYIVQSGLALSRFSGLLLERVAADKSSWPLIESWKTDPSPAVRAAAVIAVYQAPDALAKSVLTDLLSDPDAVVAARAFHVLLYGSPEGPRGWRFEVALDAIASMDEPLSALDQLLSTVRYRQKGQTKLSAPQKRAVRDVLLKTAEREQMPSRQQLLMAMQELERHKIEVAFDWLRARLAYLKRGERNVWLQPLPDDMAQFIIPRRKTAEGNRLLAEVLAEVERESTRGAYRMAVDMAIEWLGRDSQQVTTKVREWIAGGPRLRDLAVSFVMTNDWRVYTERVKIVLDARPNDHELARSLVGPRYPSSWIGDLSRFYRSQADRYGQWARSRDPRLRQLGLEAVAAFEQLDAQEEAREQRLRDGFE